MMDLLNGRDPLSSMRSHGLEGFLGFDVEEDAGCAMNEDLVRVVRAIGDAK